MKKKLYDVHYNVVRPFFTLRSSYDDVLTIQLSEEQAEDEIHLWNYIMYNLRSCNVKFVNIISIKPTKEELYTSL